jgi:hypothetical protein
MWRSRMMRFVSSYALSKAGAGSQSIVRVYESRMACHDDRSESGGLEATSSFGAFPEFGVGQLSLSRTGRQGRAGIQEQLTDEYSDE